MKNSSESDTPGIPDEINVLKDLLGPFANAPQEEEDFQMIDLDTGEPVENEDELLEVELLETDSSEESESVVLDASSLFDESDEADLDQLEDALDAAFDKFKMAQKNLVGEDDESESEPDILDPSELDAITSQVAENTKDDVGHEDNNN